MAKMTAVMSRKALRILGMGEPGTGKTGSLACLANAGYRLRIMDLDGNTGPLFQFIDKDKWDNVDIVRIADTMVLPEASPTPASKGMPKAHRAMWRLLDEWKDPGAAAGTGLGAPSTWGNKDIIIVDGLTKLSEAAMRHTLAVTGRTMMNRRQSEWGVAQQICQAFIDTLTSDAIPCHVIVFSHLKAVGPKIIQADDAKGVSDEIATTLNEQQVGLIPTRLYPTALGQDLARTFAGNFEIALLYETRFNGDKFKRVIRTVPQPAVSAKLPAVNVLAELPIEDGLLTIFNALAAKGETKNGKGK